MPSHPLDFWSTKCFRLVSTTVPCVSALYPVQTDPAFDLPGTVNMQKGSTFGLACCARALRGRRSE